MFQMDDGTDDHARAVTAPRMDTRITADAAVRASRALPIYDGG